MIATLSILPIVIWSTRHHIITFATTWLQLPANENAQNLVRIVLRIGRADVESKVDNE